VDVRPADLKGAPTLVIPVEEYERLLLLANDTGKDAEKAEGVEAWPARPVSEGTALMGEKLGWQA
jgi:hypothetical protein